MSVADAAAIGAAPVETKPSRLDRAKARMSKDYGNIKKGLGQAKAWTTKQIKRNKFLLALCIALALFAGVFLFTYLTIVLMAVNVWLGIGFEILCVAGLFYWLLKLEDGSKIMEDLDEGEVIIGMVVDAEATEVKVS